MTEEESELYDLAPDSNEPGDHEAPAELADLETHPDEIVPDNVDKVG